MAGGKDKRGGSKASIVIRREEIVEGGHHGGAWKVAYADFVTAMMAFFLLMWLLNATSAQQRSGIADYFSPSNSLATLASGFGAPFGGHTPNDEGALASDRGYVTVMNEKTRPIFEVDDDDSDTPASAATTPNGQPGVNTRTAHGAHQAGGPAEKAVPKLGDQVQAAPAPGPQGGKPEDTKQAQIRAEAAQKERARFEEAAQQIRDQVTKDPALADLARQLAIDITPEGLRIQMLDEDKQPMFATGSSALNDRARALLLKVAPILMKLPESISITGHTDATPFHGGDRSNWELSADRANATRRLFAEAGLPEAQVQTVSGDADRDPLLPAEPLAAANRRIAIVVLRSNTPKPGP